MPEGLGRWETWALLALVLLATLIRAQFMGAPMRYDEAYTFDVYVIRSLRQIISIYDVPNNQIFYSVLTHVVWRIFGNHLWTVRAVALIAGIAMVPMSYLLARDLYGRVAGLWAAALVATFAPLVDYSVDGRGYELGTFLVVLLAWLGWRALNRSSTRLWVGFAVCAALAVYSVPTMLYGVATVAVWLAGVLAVRREPGDLRLALQLGVSLAAAGVLMLLLYAPVLGQAGWTYDQPLPLDRLGGFVSGIWGNWNRAAPLPWELLIAAGFVMGVLMHRRISKDRFPLASAAAVVLGLVIVVDEIAPYIRNWLYLVPFYLITSAAGLSWAFGAIGRRTARTQLAGVAALAVVTVGLAINMFGSSQRGAEQPPFTDNDIVSFIKGHLAPDETVALDTPMEVPSNYYFNRSGYSLPTFSPAAQQAGRLNVLVLMIGNPGPAGVTSLLHKNGASVGPHTEINPLARMEFISAYSVRLPPVTRARPKSARRHGRRSSVAEKTKR